MKVDKNFVDTQFREFGREGRDWAESLPTLIAQIASRWELELGEVHTPLTYNYVQYCMDSHGVQRVLKVCFPNQEFAGELAALTAFKSGPIVQASRLSHEFGAILLQRLDPGNDLASTFPDEDERACRVFAELSLALHRPYVSTPGFRNVAEFGHALNGCTGTLIESATSIYRDLCASQTDLKLLHGDLHHGNILFDTHVGYRVIDPKGYVAETLYEVGTFVRNPLNLIDLGDQLPPLLGSRIEILSDLFQADPARTWAWSFAQAVLSWRWDNPNVTIADTISPVSEALWKIRPSGF